MPDSSRIYMWLEGQFDNIGDSALRRGYADSLAKHGPLTVWAGSKSEAYTSGLGLRSTDWVPGTFCAWLSRLYIDALKGRAAIALNAGEFGLSKKFSLRLAGIVPAVLVNRLQGQPVIWLGAGVPNPRRGTALAIKFLAHLCTELAWRDSVSPTNVIEATVQPDWGFALKSFHKGGSAGRDRLAIVLRGDRPFPSRGWLDAVGEIARRHQLTPTVVVQVERDQERAELVAAALEAHLVGWGTDMHMAQEELVRRTYRQSSVVLGDRLHALVIGLTEGAVPLGWTEHATVKLRSHFHVVGLDWVALRAPGEAQQKLKSLSAEQVEDMRTSAVDALRDARAQLAKLPLTWSSK